MADRLELLQGNRKTNTHWYGEPDPSPERLEELRQESLRRRSLEPNVNAGPPPEDDGELSVRD
jgi:hypothetical protein